MYSHRRQHAWTPQLTPADNCAYVEPATVIRAVVTLSWLLCPFGPLQIYHPFAIYYPCLFIARLDCGAIRQVWELLRTELISATNKVP